MCALRELPPDQYTVWDRFVGQLPHGGLFHTIAWNQMLCETAANREKILPLVYWEKDGIRAGMIVRYRLCGGKKIADLPAFGYSEPILCEELNPVDQCHTYPSYTVTTELLRVLMRSLDSIQLEGSPNLWDIRPFVFESWKSRTVYTHLWEALDGKDAWGKIDPQVQNVIRSVQDDCLYQVENAEDRIERFVKYSSRRVPAQVLRKRIAWMQARGICRLHVLSDKSGTDLAMTLSIMNFGNRIANLWGTMCLDPRLEAKILPVLLWHTYLSLIEECWQIDIGGTEDYRSGLLKDKLGCKPVPRFVLTYQRRRF